VNKNPSDKSKVKDIKKIHFGIICNGKSLEEWQIVCIRHLLNLRYARIALLILMDTDEMSIWQTPFQKWVYTVYRYSWFRSPPRRHVDMHDFLSDIPTIRPSFTIEKKYSWYCDQQSLKTIRSYDLDFILHFGRFILRGDILDTPKYGIWGFHHDDPLKYRGSPGGGFWEIYNGDHVGGAILQRFTERLDNGVVLKRGLFDIMDYSYLKNVNKIYLESALWPAQVCQDISSEKASYLHDAPVQSQAKIYHPPTNGQMLYFFCVISRNWIKHVLKKIWRIVKKNDIDRKS
jgi:hypothetical protein